MTAGRVPPSVALRLWSALGQRHRRMAGRLHRDGCLDGAVFHLYHARECIMSAFVAARGVAVPPTSHVGRIRLFEQFLDPPRPYAVAYRTLRYLTLPIRNQSLSYDEGQNLFPADRYEPAFVDQLLTDVDHFALAVWQEIR